MPATIAILREQAAAEARVAMVPAIAQKCAVSICMETGAGQSAGYADEAYDNVTLVADRQALLASADIVCGIKAPQLADLAQCRPGTIIIGLLDPNNHADLVEALISTDLKGLALEQVPRITRAQAMDVLSSQAAVAGYQAALLAADLSPRFFPMLTTAAGTIRPSHVVVIGAGVAGLQAIATAKRLGAVVQAYDIRPEAREQIESLGATMIDLSIDARGEGGYARELTTEEKQQQQAVLAEHLSRADVVISTAAIPGRPAPRIITQEMVDAMQNGAVVVDMAAETGGNCALTQVGELRDYQGVRICGYTDLASRVAKDASAMFAKNIQQFLNLLTDEQGELAVNWDDEILQACLVRK